MNELNCIILLGVWAGDDAGRAEMTARCLRAVAQYVDLHGCRVILSGGQLPGEPEPEGERMRRELLALGIPPADITVEASSRTTVENMRVCMAMASGRKTYIITSDYHALRVKMILRRLNMQAEVVTCATPRGARKARQWFMERLYMADIALGWQDEDAHPPKARRWVMRLFGVDKPQD